MAGVCHPPLTLRKLSGIGPFSPALPLAISGARYAPTVNSLRPAAALVVLSLLAAAPGTARAEVFAAVSGGVGFPSDTTRYGTLQAQGAAAVAVGYDFEYVGGSIWVGFLNTTAGAALQQSAWPIVVRARGRLPVGVFVPFVFGGVGLAPSRLLVNMVRYDAVAFVGQVGGGADFLVGELVTIGVEAGYQWLKTSYDYGSIDTSGVLLLGTLGVRFP
jgi:hypothetical protein